MTEEQYKKLNNYLNSAFKELEKNNSFFLKNIFPIAKLSNIYNFVYKNIEIENKSITNNISFENVMLLAREIIETIDKNYLKDFDQLIKTGELDFSYDSEYFDSHFRWNRETKQKLININRSYNYGDVRVLIHEFIHYTNCGICSKSSNVLLTEFLSIYFEQYAIDYMIKKGIDKDEIDYNSRYIDTNRKANLLCNYAVVMLVYEQIGNIDKDSCKLINDHFIAISEEEFNKICLKTIEIISNKYSNYKFDTLFENKYDEERENKTISSLVSNDYCYILGTIFAIYALEYCDINKIIELNNSKINNNLINGNIFIIFKNIGIDITSSNFNDNILDCIQKRLTKYNKVKI